MKCFPDAPPTPCDIPSDQVPVLKEYPENPKGRKVVLRSRDLCDEGRKVQRSEGLESASAAHSGALRGECASVHRLEFPVFVPSALE